MTVFVSACGSKISAQRFLETIHDGTEPGVSSAALSTINHRLDVTMKSHAILTEKA